MRQVLVKSPHLFASIKERLLGSKKLLAALGVLGLLLALVFISDVRWGLAPVDPKDLPTRKFVDAGILPPIGRRLGTALKIKDTVSFQHNKAWKKLPETTGVHPQDIFTTKLAGEVAMEFYNGGRAVLSQEGVLKLETGNPPVWNLLQGRLLAASGKKNLWIETPHAHVEMQPESVALVLSDEKKSVVAMALGTTQVMDRFKAFDPQMVTQGLKTVVLRGGGPAPPITDDHQGDIAYLAQEYDTVLATDKSLRKVWQKVLGGKSVAFASILPLAAMGQATPPSKPAPPPAPKPAAPPKPVENLTQLEDTAIGHLAALRRELAIYTLQQSSPTPPQDPKQALKGVFKNGLPALRLSGGLALSGVKPACPVQCPDAASSAAWLYCVKGSVAQWRINDRDNKGRNLCLE